MSTAFGSTSPDTPSILSLFQTYLKEDSEFLHSSSRVSRSNSLASHKSEFQSVRSDDSASFRSLSGFRSREGSSDFQSMAEESQTRERSGSFSSLAESATLRQRRPQRMNRRNSVFSITSATHSLGRRVEPSFVTACEGRGDSMSLAEVSESGSSSVHRMNLNVSDLFLNHLQFRVFDMLPIDFPLVSLANVHPCYLSIRPEDVTVDMSMILESVTIVLTNNKTDRRGVACHLTNLVADTTHTLMTRFVDISLESLVISYLNSSDYSTSEAITEGHALFASSSHGPFLTLKSTYYMPQSVLAGKLLMHVTLALFEVSLDSYLFSFLQLIHSFFEPIQTTLKLLHSKETPSASVIALSNPLPSSSQRDFEVHADCEGCVVNIQSNDVELNLSFHTVRYCMNTKEKHKQELQIGSLKLTLNNACVLKLGNGPDWQGVVVSVSSSNELVVVLTGLECTLCPFIQLNLIQQLIQVSSFHSLDYKGFSGVAEIGRKLWFSSEVTSSSTVVTTKSSSPFTTLTLTFVNPMIQISFNDLQVVYSCGELTSILQIQSIVPCFSVHILDAAFSINDSFHSLNTITDLSATLDLNSLEGNPEARSIEFDIQSISLCLEPALMLSIQRISEALIQCQSQLYQSLPHSHESTSSYSVLSPSVLQFDVSITKASVSLSSNTSTCLILSLSNLQLSLLMSEILQGSFFLLDVSLSTQSRSLLRRQTTDVPFLVLTLDNHSLSADLIGIQIELGFDFPETLATLLSDWSKTISSSNQHSSNSNEFIQQLVLLLHEKYAIELNVEDMSLSLVDREQSVICSVSTNSVITFCVNDSTICEYMVLLYGLTCVFDHYVQNQYSHTSSVIDLPVAISLHVSGNSHLSITTSVDQIEATRIADSNPTNSLLLSLNTAQLVLDVVSHFKSALHVLEPSSPHTSHSSSLLQIECDIPAVMFRLELAHNLVVFIGLHHFLLNGENTFQHFHTRCVLNANYTFDSPLQTLLEELDCEDRDSVSFLVQCTGILNEDISVSVTPSSALQMNLPWNVLRALSAEENETREPTGLTYIENEMGGSLMYS